MRAVRRTLSFLIFAVPMAALIVIGVLTVRRMYPVAERDLAPILAGEMSKTLGHETRVGSVRIEGRSARIENIHVAEGKTFAAGNGREMASAREAIVDFDLRTILLEQNVPLFATIQVMDPVARIARSASGVWNFSDIFAQPRQPSPRQTVGLVIVTNGTVTYDDSAAPHNKQRTASPFMASFANVSGHLHFSSDRSIDWTATGREASGRAAALKVVGSYSPAGRRLFLRLNGTRVWIPVANRFLPPGTDVDSGWASGEVTITRAPGEAGGFIMDYDGDVTVADASARSIRLREPVTAVSGRAAFTDASATGFADGTFAGTRLHVAGTLLNPAAPILSGTVSGSGVELNRLLAALGLGDRFPALRGLTATADVRAEVRGTPGNLSVSASGPATAEGRLPNGILAPRNGSLQISMAGPLTAPRFVATGTIPVVRYRQYEARNVWVAASYVKDQAAADFTAVVGGGTVSGRVSASPAGKRTTYLANIRARGVEAAQLPLRQWKVTAGRFDADIAAQGRLDQRLPQGTADVRVTHAQWERWTAANADARIVTHGDVLDLQSLVASDPKGYLIASGQINAATQALDLNVDADALDLSRLPLTAATEEKPQISGFVYVRDGHVTGTLKAPLVDASLRAYALAVGDRLSLDYASARIQGSRKAVDISHGQAWRFPAFAEASGRITDPLTKNAQIDLTGDFSRVDMQELASMAGSTMEASGTASGQWKAGGELLRPTVTVDPLTVTAPGIGKYAFDRLSASLVWDGTQTPTKLELTRFRAEYGTTTGGQPGVAITGSGSLSADGDFAGHAAAHGVDLALLAPYTGDYVSLRGTGDVSADVSGALKSGKAEELQGTVDATTTGLRVNDVDFGDLDATIALGPQSATGRLHPKQVSTGPVGGSAPGLYVDSFVYNWQEKRFAAYGRAVALQLEMLRQALSRSPYVVKQPESVAAAWLKPIANPFEGTLGVAFHAAGPTDNPQATIHWAADKMVVESQAIDQFSGDVTATRDRVTLRDATLRAENATVSASGFLVPGKQIDGNIDAHDLPLHILRRWFPDNPNLQELTGTADQLSVHATGAPDAPDVVASADLSEIRWVDPDVERKLFGGQPVELPRVTSGAITLRDGRVTVSDLGVLIREPALTLEKPPAILTETTAIAGVAPRTATPESVGRSVPQVASTPAPAVQRPVYEIHASGSVDFSWDQHTIPADASAQLQVRVRNQGLGMLRALMPNANLTLDGTIREASLTYDGNLEQITNPRRASRHRPALPAPKINGVVDVVGNRIASPYANTELRGLDARVLFDGDRLRVDHFAAHTRVVNPRYASKDSPPITIAGELPIQPGAGAGLTVTAPGVFFAESPLPVIKSGGVIGEIGTDDPRTKQTVESIAITGTLFEPLISGTLYVQNTIFRMPETFASAAGGPIALPFAPRFDLRVVAVNDVRASTAQMTAYVTTSPTQPVSITGPLDDVKVSGMLLVDRGTLTFPTARFTIQRGGQVEIRYPFNPIGPSAEKSLGVLVNVTATTRLTAQSVTGVSRRYTITVQANGPLNSGAPLSFGGGESPFPQQQLRLTFRSDPPDLALSEAGLRERVTGILGGQGAIEELFSSRPNIGRIVSEQFSNIISTSFLPDIFERSGLARALGLEEFQIEYNQLDAFSLRISRQLIGPIYLSYWRRLSGVNLAGNVDRAAWEFKLSYRIRPNLQFSWTTDEQGTNAYLIEGVFKF